MDAASILLVLAAVGVDFGWQSASDAPQASPTRHTAYFAGQPGWEPERANNPPPAAAPIYDRYQVAPTGTPASSPPPNISDRTRMAATETGNALREGVEAGIQAANQQLYRGGEQAIEATRSAGQEASQQFQGWIGNTGGSIQPMVNSQPAAAPQTTGRRSQVSNPFAPANPTAVAAPAANSKTTRGVAPPPWTGSSATNEPDWPADSSEPAAIERTASVGAPAPQPAAGWTSLKSTVAPPALIHPPLMNSAPASAAPPLPATGGSGPGFPAATSANQRIDRPPVEQSRAATAATPAKDGWDIGWDGGSPAQPATIGSRYQTNNTTARNDAAPARDSGATQPASIGAANSQPAAAGFDAWDDNDPWGDRPPASPAGTLAKREAGTAAGPVIDNPASQPAAGTAAASSAPPATNANATPIAGAAPASASAPAKTPTGDQPPWMPLLVVSVSLAGSLGANLFLGWSYVDARYKYRSLVQKTANKFRRAVAA